MDPTPDPTVQRQTEDFRHQLDAMAAQHRQAMQVLFAYGLMRDLGIANDPPPARRSLWVEVGTWLKRRLRQALTEEPGEHARPKVVIIEPDGTEHVASYKSDSFSAGKEER